MPPVLYVGVDGGGSRCRVRVRDAAGALVGEAIGGAANVYLDFPTALDTIRTTIAVAAAGADPSLLHLGLGLAGVSSAAIGLSVQGGLTGFRSVRVENDGVIACFGAHAGKDGGLVIAGTGSVAVLHLHGVITTFAGRGFVLGDDGSGAQMGRAIWRRALRASDRLEPWTPLLRSLMTDFGDDPVAVITWARTAPSHAFATAAPRVFEAAGAGDPAGLAVATDAGRAISELVAALVGRGAPHVALMGGLAGVIRPYLEPAALPILSEPVADPLEGALLMAREAATRAGGLA